MSPSPQYLSPLTKAMGILPSVGKDPAPRVHPTQNLKQFLNRLPPATKPHLLDLGRIYSPNIDWLIHRGFRISVDDRTTPRTLIPDLPAEREADEKERPPALHLEDLDYAACSFEGVLCWDLFDYLAPDEARKFLAELERILKPGGLLLTLFNFNRHASPPPTRYRIRNEEQLEYEFLTIAAIPRRAYENREIQDLFSGFRLINSCFLKNQMREVLVQKK